MCKIRKLVTKINNIDHILELFVKRYYNIHGKLPTSIIWAPKMHNLGLSLQIQHKGWIFLT